MYMVNGKIFAYGVCYELGLNVFFLVQCHKLSSCCSYPISKYTKDRLKTFGCLNCMLDECGFIFGFAHSIPSSYIYCLNILFVFW